jgi:hypothetical protein
MHHSEVDDNKPLLKVVNEIVHVYETREQIEFKDSTRAKMAAILTNGVLKIPHRAHLSAAVGAGAPQGLWEHKGSRCTPANAAHSPPRRSPEVPLTPIERERSDAINIPHGTSGTNKPAASGARIAMLEPVALSVGSP